MLPIPVSLTSLVSAQEQGTSLGLGTYLLEHLSRHLLLPSLWRCLRIESILLAQTPGSRVDGRGHSL